MENIAKHHFKTASATPLMARFKSGFLIKDILERFTKKIFGTLDPNRSLWIYSAHDDTISNTLNTLRLFEVNLNQLFTFQNPITTFNFQMFSLNSCIFHHTRLAYTLNCSKQRKMNTTFSSFTGKRTKNIHSL